MGTSREHDPLTELILRAHAGVLERLDRVARGELPARELASGREVLNALASAEAKVLFPAFGRVTMRLETERLLEDCRDNRARQKETLEALMHKRSPRLRKLKAVELADLIQHHGQQLVTLLVPVLRSQLPRTLYGAVSNAFSARYTEALTGTSVRPRVAVAPSPRSAAAR